MLRQCLAIQTDSLQQNIGIWMRTRWSIVQLLKWKFSLITWLINPKSKSHVELYRILIFIYTRAPNCYTQPTRKDCLKYTVGVVGFIESKTLQRMLFLEEPMHPYHDKSYDLYCNCITTKEEKTPSQLSIQHRAVQFKRTQLILKPTVHPRFLMHEFGLRWRMYLVYVHSAI